MSRLAEFTSFMQNKMVGYTELLTKYNGLKEKECAVMTQTGGKKERKELLLRMKEKKTLSKEEQLELEHIERESDIEANYRRNIRTIQTRKERAEEDAERIYLSAIAKAEAIREQSRIKAMNEYEKAEEYYNRERDSSITKHTRTYSTKKTSFEIQKEALEDQRNLTIKTATELAIDTQKRDLLTKMQAIIDALQLSKNQAPLADREKLPAIPVLPEVMVSQYTPQPMSSAVKEIYDMEAENSVLREEFRMKRRERDRADREREREESVRKPTVYGFIHELEGRPYVKPCYNPPVPDYEEVNAETPCDFFTKE